MLWAEKFDERFTDITTLQNSISARVVRALSLELTSDEERRLSKHYTEDSAAQQLYLAGRYHWGKRTPEGLRMAISNFEQAIAKDSRFALAYAGLADCYALQNWYLEPPPAYAFARAKGAERASRSTRAAEAQSLAFVNFTHRICSAEQSFAAHTEPNTRPRIMVRLQPLGHGAARRVAALNQARRGTRPALLRDHTAVATSSSTRGDTMKATSSV